MAYHDELMKALSDHFDAAESAEAAAPTGGGGGESDKIKLDDNRKVLASTGAAFDKKFSKAGAYDRKTIQNIIKAAKYNHVDPSTALAISLQETGLGKLNHENIAENHTTAPGVYGKAPDGIDQDAYEFTRLLKEKMEYGRKLGFKDEASQIQAYNGLGKLKSNYYVGGKQQPESYYGHLIKPGESLDMKKNPLYGKTIIDLRDNLIKNNKEIAALLK